MPSFTEVLKQKVEQLVVGDPLSSESDIGCMVDVQAAQRVEAWIQEAESMGAQLLCGEKKWSEHHTGYFAKPSETGQGRL